MLRSFSLKAKLLGMCALLSAMTAALGYMNLLTNKKMSETYEHVAAINLVNIKTLGDMHVEFKQARLRAFRAAMPGLERTEIQSLGTEINQAIDKYVAADKAYTSLEWQPGEEVIYQKVNRIWEEHKRVLQRIGDLLKSDNPAVQQELLKLINKDFLDTTKHFDPAIDELKDFHNKEAVRWVGMATEAQSQAKMLSWIVTGSSVLLGLLLGFMISRSLSRSLGSLADRLSEGAGAVAGAARQISDASVEASSATSQQAAALQQTVASIDEVSAMVNKNAENARRSLEASTATKAAAALGKQSVDEMLSSMESISRSNSEIMAQTEDGNKEIFTLVKIINEIANKTKVINDIVFQTKLLSFNASVEAARAGEHGKGFAVVAEEVGNLAQMSGNAAKEITQMLEDSIQKVEKTVNDTKGKLDRLINAGREKVDHGTITARRCGESLDQIVRQVSDLNQMISEISTASGEQAQGVQEISKALGQIDQGMQQASAVATQSSASSEDLSNQALALDSAVDSLVGTIYGDGAKQVRSMHQAVPVAAEKSANIAPVLAFRRKQPVAKRPAFKRAVGAEDTPSAEDPRFEDI